MSEFPSSVSAEIEEVAQAPVPTEHGEFQMHVFRSKGPASPVGLSNEHVVMARGNILGAYAVPVRVHSECLTSEVFGSLKCDCKGQLESAMAFVGERPRGIVIYLRQEGRGIGLANKIRAYALQAQGADTIEANQLLHLPVDARQYDVAAAILKELGVKSIELLTNNPDKVRALSQLGVRVEKRLPMWVRANPFSASYLEVKKSRMQHELPSGVFHQKPTPEDGDSSDSGVSP